MTPERGSTWLKYWRKTELSDIWNKSPLYLRVWLWILANVDYQTGELTCTYEHISDRVSWIDKGHPHIPSRRIIHDILHWMKTNSMLRITTLGDGNRKYTKVSVCLWSTYQSSEKVDGNTYETEKSPSLKKEEEVVLKDLAVPASKNGRKRDPYMDQLAEIWATLDIPGDPPYSLFGRWRKAYGDALVLREINALYLKRESLEGKPAAYVGTILANKHAEYLESHKAHPIMPRRAW